MTLDYNTFTDEEFRAAVRSFVRAHYPQDRRNPSRRLHWHECEDWYRTLSREGWLAPGWPTEHGGMGLSASKQLIYTEEFEEYGVARVPEMGIVMLGPLLIRYGTEAQKAYHLPRILSGDAIWCQGYSEPDAGSDLASLRTEAVLDDDGWRINGQKIWTTLAGDANWMFMLVRTDKTARKQQGISFLLVPMDTPGVTVRPILNLEMHDEFSEVFFDDVRVPADHLVGEINAGWTMAKALLGFERIHLGSPRQSANALGRLLSLANVCGAADDPVVQDRLTGFRMELEDHKTLFETFADRVRRGEQLGPDVSLLKLNQSELYQRITEFGLEITGGRSGLSDPIDGQRDLDPAAMFIQSRPTTIYGGSSEIQRNIIAKTVLDLPS